MTDLIHELTKLAAAASPGQWEWSVGDGSLPTLERCDGTGESVLGVFVCPSCLKSKLPCMAPTPADAAYIAKANPENIKRLLDVVRALRELTEVRRRMLVGGDVSTQAAMDAAWQEAARVLSAPGGGRPAGLTIAQLGRIESGVVLSQVIEDHCGQPPEPPEEPAPILHYAPNGNISRCGIVWTAKRIITSRRTRFRDQVTCKKCLRAMAVKS